MTIHIKGCFLDFSLVFKSYRICKSCSLWHTIAKIYCPHLLKLQKTSNTKEHYRSRCILPFTQFVMNIFTTIEDMQSYKSIINCTSKDFLNGSCHAIKLTKLTIILEYLQQK